MISECISRSEECTSLISVQQNPKEHQNNHLYDKYVQVLRGKGVRMLQQHSQKSVVELTYQSLNKDFRIYTIKYGFVEVEVSVYFLAMGEYQDSFLKFKNQKPGRFYQYFVSHPQLLIGKLKRAATQKILKLLVEELGLKPFWNTDMKNEIEDKKYAGFDIIFNIQQDMCFLPLVKVGTMLQNLIIGSKAIQILQGELKSMINFLNKILVADFFVFSFFSPENQAKQKIMGKELAIQFHSVGKLEDYRIQSKVSLLFHPALYCLSSLSEFSEPCLPKDLTQIVINEFHDLDIDDSLSKYLKLIASLYLGAQNKTVSSICEDKNSKLFINNTRLLINLLVTLYNQLSKKDYMRVRTQLMKSMSNIGISFNTLGQDSSEKSENSESSQGETQQALYQEEGTLVSKIKILSKTKILRQTSKRDKIRQFDKENEYLFNDSKKKIYKIIKTSEFKMGVKQPNSKTRTSSIVQIYRNLSLLRLNPYSRLKNCLHPLHLDNQNKIQVFDEVASNLLQLPIISLGQFIFYYKQNRISLKNPKLKQQIQDGTHQTIYSFISSFIQQAGNHILQGLHFKLMRQQGQVRLLKEWILFLKLMFVSIRFLLTSQQINALFKNLSEYFVQVVNKLIAQKESMTLEEAEVLWFQCITENIVSQCQKMLGIQIERDKLKQKAIDQCLNNITIEERLKLMEKRGEVEQIKHEVRISSVTLLKQISKLYLFPQTTNKESYIKFFFELLSYIAKGGLSVKLKQLSGRVLSLKKKKLEQKQVFLLYNYLTIFKSIINLSFEIVSSIHPTYFVLFLSNFSEIIEVFPFSKRLYIICEVCTSVKRTQREQLDNTKSLEILDVPQYIITYKKLLSIGFKQERKDEMIEMFELTLDQIKEGKRKHLADNYRILIGIKLLNLSYQRYQFYQYRSEIESFLFQFFQEHNNECWFFQIKKLIDLCYYTQNKKMFIDEFTKLEMTLFGRVKQKWRNQKQKYRTIDRDFETYFSVFKYEDDQIFKTICSYANSQNIQTLSFYLHLRELCSFVTQCALTINTALNHEKNKYLYLISAFCSSQTEVFYELDLTFFQQFHQSIAVQLARSRNQKYELKNRQKTYDNIQQLDYFYNNREVYGQDRWKKLWKRQYENMIECNQYYYHEVLNSFVRFLDKDDCLSFIKENEGNDRFLFIFGLELLITKKRTQENYIYFQQLFKRVCHIFYKFYAYAKNKQSIFLRKADQIKIFFNIIAYDISIEKGNLNKAHGYLTKTKNSLKRVSGSQQNLHAFEIIQKYFHIAHALYDKETDPKLKARRKFLKSMCHKCGYPSSEQYIPEVIIQQLIKRNKLLQRSMQSKLNKFDIHQV